MKRNWLERNRVALMSSLFALFLSAGSLFGAETNQENQQLKPVIRSSQTEMVQAGDLGSAEKTTDVAVQQDGGSVERSAGEDVIDTMNSSRCGLRRSRYC